MIVLDKENKFITLHTKNTSYQMKVWDYNIFAAHLLWPPDRGR